MDSNHHIEAYLDRLFGYALSLVGERDEARELVQICVLKALAAHKVPNDEPAYRAWLFRIQHNVFIDQHRQRGHAIERGMEDELPTIDWLALQQHEAAMLNSLTVRMGMRRLSAKHREILALIDIAGFSYSEAAAHLEVPAGTVMSRLSRARKALLVSLTTSNVRAFAPKRNQK